MRAARAVRSGPELAHQVECGFRGQHRRARVHGSDRGENELGGGILRDEPARSGADGPVDGLIALEGGQDDDARKSLLEAAAPRPSRRSFAATMRAVASMPSSTGIRMSISTMSGLVRRQPPLHSGRRQRCRPPRDRPAIRAASACRRRTTADHRRSPRGYEGGDAHAVNSARGLRGSIASAPVGKKTVTKNSASGPSDAPAVNQPPARRARSFIPRMPWPPVPVGPGLRGDRRRGAARSRSAN